MAIDAVGRLHSLIADRTDLDLEGDSRQAAAWVIAGRCIGLARAMLSLLRDGYAAEAIPTARGLHEATRLLDAVADDEEVELLGRWLADDDWVRPRETRAARERMRDRLEQSVHEQHDAAMQAGDTERAEAIAEQLQQRGFEEPGTTSALSRSIYDTLLGSDTHAAPGRPTPWRPNFGKWRPAHTPTPGSELTTHCGRRT